MMHTKKSHLGLWFFVLALLFGTIFIVVGEQIENIASHQYPWSTAMLCIYVVVGSKVAAIGALIIGGMIDDVLYWRNPYRLHT